MLVRWRYADFYSVSDIVRSSVAVCIEPIGGCRADIIRVVSGVCSESGDGNFDGVSERLRVGEIGGWQNGVEDGGLYGDIEGVSSGNPVHDLERGNPPK